MNALEIRLRIRGFRSALAAAAACAALCPAIVARAGAASGAEEAFFKEGFDGDAWGPAWTETSDDIDFMSVNNGALEFHLPMSDAAAYIERPFDAGNARVSFAVRQPMPGCVPALYLAWGQDMWCKAGIMSDKEKTEFYGAYMIEGKLTEMRRAGASPEAWNYLAIELGADAIRFLHSADGRTWESFGVFFREEGAMAEPPAALAIGRGVVREKKSDQSGANAIFISMADNIRVEPTPELNLAASAKELKALLGGPDEPGESELAVESDPSFASVSRHYRPMLYPREALGTADGLEEFIVMTDASLEFVPLKNGFPDPYDQKGRTRLFFEFEEPAATGAPARLFQGCERQLMSGYLPVVAATWRHGGLEYTQTCLGWSPGMAPDAELTACIRLDVHNLSDKDTAVSIRAVRAGEDSSTAVHWKSDVNAHRNASIEIKALCRGTVDDIHVANPDEFGSRLDETVRFWEGMLARGMTVNTPERRVNDAFRAWKAYAFMLVDKRGGLFCPHDGAGFYEQIYGYSAALYCNALDLVGHHAEAERYLDSLLKFVSPEDPAGIAETTGCPNLAECVNVSSLKTFSSSDGLFMVNFGLPDHGALLFALGMHYRLTGNMEWLRSVAPTMARMCEWIAAQRAECRSGQDPGSAVYGLIKGRPFCDHGSPAYCYFSDAYLCSGLRCAAEALADLGMDWGADRHMRESEEYRRDILESMRRSEITHRGLRVLPMFPETHYLLKNFNYSCRGYYGLIASCLLECDFMGEPEAEAQAKTITTLMRERGGLCLGVCRFDAWGGFAIDHAYTYGYWMDCLRRGEPERVILGFYASLAYGMSRGTYSGVEVHMIESGANNATLPHLYSNLQQMRILRNMLVAENGADLLLCQAVPADWLAPGNKIEVRDAPTLFGTAGFSVESSDAGAKLDFEIKPLPGASTPEAVRIRLRRPDKKPVVSAVVSGISENETAGDTLIFRNPRGPVSAQVGF